MSASPAAATVSAATLRGGLIAAIFLMATSAIGPGFITQTATFTAQLGAAFAFAILASILIDFVVQMNIWRITALTGKRASETANAAIPGAGYLLSVLVIFGGLVFNVGNIAGAGLGLNAMIGLDPKIGGALSALLAIGIFLSHRGGPAARPDHRLARPGDDRPDAARRGRSRTRRWARRCARRSCRRPSTSPPSPPSSAARSADTSPTPARTGCSTRG